MASPKPLSTPVSRHSPVTASDRPFPKGKINTWGTAGQNLLADGIFSSKTLVAALLAYALALSIQLERPYWAIITCYIVAQPLTGALLSKGLYRLIGTVIGAGAAILLVPNLSNAPELLVAALTLWLAACTYIAALDRTPRSYVSLLAGYSAIIVAVPTVNAPETIFDVAIARVQEIGIGIICVSLVHALVLPRPVWQRVRDRLDGALADARQWSGHALAVPPRPQAIVWQDRRKLASDLHELHLLSTHMPYDMTSPAVTPAVLRAAQVQLGLLLPLASAVEDRIAALHEPDAPTRKLIEDVREWIARGTLRDPAPLLSWARALEPDLHEPVSWRQLLHLSLLDRLGSLIRAHGAAMVLRDALLDETTLLPDGLLTNDSQRALHRDHGIAVRASAAIMLTVLATCSLWIISTWPEAGSAVVTAAIICALFSHLDTPVRAAWRAVIGTMGAALAASACAFWLIPHAADFISLSLLIAPFLLFLGWLLARPERAPYGIGAVLSFPGLAGLDIAYDSNFASFANQALTQILGALIACLMLSAVRDTGAASAIRRLTRAGWRELSARTQPKTPPQTSQWISRMLDRIVMQGPHLAALPNGDALTEDRLRDLRIGMALDDLQRASGLPRHRLVLTARLRTTLAAAQRAGVLHSDAALTRAIENALASANTLPPSPAKRSLLLALVGLHRCLAG